MTSTTTPDRRAGHRITRAVIGLTVTSAVVLTATTAMAAALTDRADPGPLSSRVQPPRLPIVHGGSPSPVDDLRVSTLAAPAPAKEPVATATVAPQPLPTTTLVAGTFARTPGEHADLAPSTTAAPASPPSTTAAPTPAPTTTAPPAIPAPARCVISYGLDGVDPQIARAAFDVVEAQAPVRFEAATGAPMLHIRSYWPADNPTAAFGWTGPVHGQLSIYLKPILERTPDFARLMLVHELGHVLGLGHTASGTPMDDMPTTDTFTTTQHEQMVLPC